MAKTPSKGRASYKSVTYHEPSSLEVFITIAVGNLFGSVYKTAVESLELQGNERVLDFGSGAGTPARFLARKLAGVAARSPAWTSPKGGSKLRRSASRGIRMSCSIGVNSRNWTSPTSRTT